MMHGYGLLPPAGGWQAIPYTERLELVALLTELGEPDAGRVFSVAVLEANDFSRRQLMVTRYKTDSKGQIKQNGSHLPEREDVYYDLGDRQLPRWWTP